MAELLKALGVMSGTSMDGVDIAMLGTDGEATAERGPFSNEPYPAALRARIAAGLAAARAITERSQRPASLAALETELTEFHGQAILGYLGRTGIEASSVDVIGYHGHTVLHRPEQQLTVQLGDGAMLARMTGRPVVNDLRAADMLAGGEGAPLVPVYHRMLAGRAPDRPVAFINIGGVANVTWVGRDGALLAFDCGPGNALMDDWALRHTGQPVDVDGALARSGKADETVLRTYLLNVLPGTAGAEIARSRRLHAAAGRASPGGRRRRHVGAPDGGDDCPCRGVVSGAADLVDRGRRRPAQPLPDGASGLAPDSAGGAGGSARFRRRCDRGGGLGLSCGAQPQGAADHLPDDHPGAHGR